MTATKSAWPAALALASIMAIGTHASGPDLPAGRLYVTSWFGGVVSVADLKAGALRQTIPVGIQNHNVFLAPDRKTAWVTNNSDGTVTVIDTATDKTLTTIAVGTGPRHTFFSPDGGEAYVTVEFDNAVAVIDAKSMTVREHVHVGHMPHFAMVVGDKLFVTNFGSADVPVVSRRDRKVLGTIPVGYGPLGASVTRDGTRLYIAAHSANQVAVIDTATHAVVARVPTEPGPVQVTVAPDQRHAYVAADGRGTVQKIDLTTNQVVKTIHIAPDAGTHGITFAGNGRFLMVTNMGNSTVSIIDTTTDHVVQSLRVAGHRLPQKWTLTQPRNLRRFSEFGGNLVCRRTATFGGAARRCDHANDVANPVADRAISGTIRTRSGVP